MTLTRSGNEIAEYFALAVASGERLGPNHAPIRPRFNIAPSQDLATILFEPGLGRRLEWMRWGLIPSWAHDPSIGARLFNARSETVATKPSFRSAFKDRRCLIAADGFYEWSPRNRGHQPFYFESTEGTLLAFAGLFESFRAEDGEVIDSCTVLTTEASGDVSDIHHRMPVLLDAEQCELWLNPESRSSDLNEICASRAEGRLRKRAVGRNVNDARRDDASCLESKPQPVQAGLFNLDGEG
jgi:putative SOS response-associated peptidase YedK